MDSSTSAFRAAVGATLLLVGVLLLLGSVGAAGSDGPPRTASAQALVLAKPKAS